MEPADTTPTKPQPRPRPKRPSRSAAPALPSGRLQEGRVLQAFRRELIQHCGGAPSRTQMALIDRATMLQCHIARMDKRALLLGEFSDHGSRQYLAWSNSLTRTLRHLGLEAPADRPMTAAQALDRIHARVAADAPATPIAPAAPHPWPRKATTPATPTEPDA